MSPSSIGGGYQFAFQAVSISPALLKRAEVRKIGSFIYRRILQTTSNKIYH